MILISITRGAITSTEKQTTGLLAAIIHSGVYAEVKMCNGTGVLK